MIRTFVSSYFKNEIARAARALAESFSARETDDTIDLNARSWGDLYRDRSSYERKRILDECLRAWRVNPLGRRVVNLMSEFTLGDGVEIECKHEPTRAFIDTFWSHPLNRMDEQLVEMAEELSRSGDLLVALTTDAAGMSYVRALPADGFREIETAPNDVKQERFYHPLSSADDPEPAAYPSYLYRPGARTVILHYAVNRPVGGVWGEPDLAPLIPWLARYANWLEDRVRLNRFRFAWIWRVIGKFKDATERLARQNELNQNPPMPGSILVSDESETWEALAPKLESSDAERDGLSIKKMIAAGAGVPLHYLAEPESSTRTTAEAAGTSTMRRFELRQRFLTRMVEDILRVAVARRYKRDRLVDPTAKITARAGDVTERDNAALALAVSQVAGAMLPLVDAQFITKEEYLRFVYRFAGENKPAEVTKDSKGTKDTEGAKGSVAADGNVKVDADTGEVRTSADQM